jgi:hypothetical protein
MSDMLSDINKYAQIWDKALEDGIFKDAPKLGDAAAAGSNFFGQSMLDEFDPDEPLNESQVAEWRSISQAISLSNGACIVNEESEPSKKSLQNVSKKMANTHNPVYPYSVGKDQDYQNVGVDGEEVKKLEELKAKIETLEKSLAKMSLEGKDLEKAKAKIVKLKKQYDDLSDAASGNRFDMR